MKKTQYRILHLPTPVAGCAYGISRGERKLGHISDVLIQSYENGISECNPMGYAFDMTWPFYRYSKHIIKAYYQDYCYSKKIKKLYQDYDILHFNFSTSLLPYFSAGDSYCRDLMFARNSKIIMTALGCDVRSPQSDCCYADTPFTVCSACPYLNLCRGKKGLEKEKKLAAFDRYAHHLVAGEPDLFSAMPKRTHYIPATLSTWDELESRPYQQNKTLKFIHAPTCKGIKGSDYFIQALENLSRKYPGKFEYELLSGVTNKIALEKYREADLILDQLKIGWHGILTLECMKMGKPVLVGINKNLFNFLPAGQGDALLSSVISASTESIEEKLEDIILNPGQLYDVVKNAHEYVYEYHSPEHVATQYINLYQQ